MKMLSTFALLLIAFSLQAATGNGSPASTATVSDSLVSGSAGKSIAVESTQSLSLSIKNTKGEILMQQTFTASDATKELQLPQLPAGLYLITVKNGAKAQTQKFSIR